MTNEKTKLITCLAMTTFLSFSGMRMTSAQEEDAPPPKPAAPAQASGPIDITADEQEFAQDSVIARGRVRVLYKDSIILSPLATLYKDPEGNPNRAVFTGHPRLTQGRSKMDANMLTFEMKEQKIIAVGNAHSEVDVPEDEAENSSLAPAAKKADGKFPAPPVAAEKKVDSGNPDDDEDKPAAPVAEASSKPAKQKPPEKIITDSERQEFDQASGHFDAIGHVKVINGDMIVFADKMQVVYGVTSNKPETCLFSGRVTATQGKNTTCADTINYNLSTKRLQASGNVKSKVIQEKKEEEKDSKKKGGTPTAKADPLGLPSATAANSGTKKLSAGASATAIAATTDGDNDKPFWVFSDSQDYSREDGRMAAHGNVKVVHGEMYGAGPSVLLTKKPDGQADKVYFIGRSQITQPGRRWIADEITYVVEDKRVIANGNARAMVLQNKDSEGPLRKKVTPSGPSSTPAQVDPSRLAQPHGKQTM